MPVYNIGKYDMMRGQISVSADASAKSLFVILLSASYTGDIDAHTRYRDLSAHEISVADPGRTVGYSSGGQCLSGTPVCTVDNTNDWAKFDADDITWVSSTITARYLAIVKIRAAGANKENDNILGYIDFGSNQSSSNGNFTIQWNTNGILLLT
jgi:hypothetical protein